MYPSLIDEVNESLSEGDLKAPNPEFETLDLLSALVLLSFKIEDEPLGVSGTNSFFVICDSTIVIFCSGLLRMLYEATGEDMLSIFDSVLILMSANCFDN